MSIIQDNTTSRRVRKGVSLKTTKLRDSHPQIFSQVDWEASIELYPNLNSSDLSPGSGRKLVFNCSEGHTYRFTVKNRTKKDTGCPVCRSIFHLYPGLAAEWSEDNPKTAQQVTPGSQRYVNWVCSLGHTYDASPYSRFRGDGCPYCSGHRVLTGFNDLATTHPELLTEWDTDKNDKSPNEISFGSAYKAHWICEAGHEWDAPLCNRTKGSGCPECCDSGKSQIEQRLANQLSNLLGVSVVGINHKTDVYWPHWNHRLEVDIELLIDGTRIAVEIDGAYWHKDKQDTDIRKTTTLLDSGKYKVVRVRTDDLEYLILDDSRLLQLSWNWSYNENELAVIAQQIVEFAR